MWQENDKVEVGDTVEIDNMNEIVLPEDEFDISPARYTKIFDTDYYWMVPYIIDFKKYKEAVDTEMVTDAKQVTILMSTSLWGDGYYHEDITCSLHVWTSGSNRKENDCFFFSDTREDIINTLKEKMKVITNCIIDVDRDEINRRINEELTDIVAANKRIRLLESLK